MYRKTHLIRRTLLTAVLGGLLLQLSSGQALSNQVTIENVRFINRPNSTGEFRVVLDLSWQNAWRNRRNHDAVWLFFKFVFPEGGFAPVKLHQTGHQLLPQPGDEMPAAQIDVSADGMGVYVYAGDQYRGNIRWRLSLALDPDSYNDRLRRARLMGYGIEMVYIPEGPFTLGDPDTTALNFGAFYRAGSNGDYGGLFHVASEDAINVGPESGQLYYRRQNEYQGDQKGPVPAAFPKGFAAFYVMKYEVSQGQYAAFLNTLSSDATFERFSFGGRGYFAKRGTIRLEQDRYVAERPDRPLNFLSWDDGLAFADWAGLRPMTELEFTKAARGPGKPLPGEFPWGSANRDQLARVVGEGDDLIMTNGWGEERLDDKNRPVFGASFYWVMDLAGSVWERTITIGQSDGRSFTGSNGDGRLGSRGRATNDDWPHDYQNVEGHGYRGGGFYDQGMTVHEFNPHSPIAYRRFGAWAGSYPYRAYGFRCARSLP